MFLHCCIYSYYWCLWIFWWLGEAEATLEEILENGTCILKTKEGQQSIEEAIESCDFPVLVSIQKLKLLALALLSDFKTNIRDDVVDTSHCN